MNHGEKLALCAGALAVHYEEIGGEVRWHGKPYPSVYASTLGLLGIADKRRVLAVGDSLRTDIAGANGAGIDSLLIAGQGIHADEFAPNGAPELARIEAAAAIAGVRPSMTAGAVHLVNERRSMRPSRLRCAKHLRMTYFYPPSASSEGGSRTRLEGHAICASMRLSGGRIASLRPVS